MTFKALMVRFSEHREIFRVIRRKGDKVELLVSTRMAFRIAEALTVYSSVEDALRQFGKEVQEID